MIAFLPKYLRLYFDIACYRQRLQAHLGQTKTSYPAESLSARAFLFGRFFSQPESLQSRGLLSNNLCLDFVVHAEIVIFPCSLLQPRLHSRILVTSSHVSPFFWQPRADRRRLRPLRFSPPPPCPIEALLTVQFFRERRDPRPHIATLPSCLLEPARLS